MADEIRSTPQNRLGGLLSSGLSYLNQGISNPFGYRNPPAEMIINAIGLPALQRTIERMSYGEPLTTGSGMTTRPRPDTLEAALAVAPLVKPTQAIGRVALEEALAANASRRAFDPTGQLGAVVMRGVTPEAIARANQLENVNASPGYILQETGLVKVPTKEGTTWGRQISDAPIQVDFEKLKTTPYEGMYFRDPLKVGDVISHPELFDLYPELKNIGLFKTADNNAYYSSAGQGQMGIPSGEYVKQYFKEPEKQFNKIRSMAVHELGHAVQNLDRMPRGGTAQEFMGQAYKNVKERADSTINSLEEAIKQFLENQGLTPPKDFKSFVQSVSYIKTNGPKYLEDVGPESRKRIEAVLSSDISNDLLDTFSRVEQAYGKIKTKEKKAFKQYQNLAGEAQSRAMEQQYLENNYKAPVTSFYDVPVESLIYRDPFGNPLR